MGTILVLSAIALVAGAGVLGMRRRAGTSLFPPRRTSWGIICYRCSRIERRPVPGCEECQSRHMAPMSKYQAEGGGTGFYPDGDGPLIASLCEGEWNPSKKYFELPEGEWHAPLFDLDFPARAWRTSDGWAIMFEKETTREGRDALQRELRKLGLVAGPCVVTSMRRPPDAPDLPGVEGYRTGGRPLAAKTVFHLNVPVRLVPSSTEGHFHLYLENKLRWNDYLLLMRYMTDAGLLEKSWVDMSERRKMAMLRKPHVRKGEEEFPLPAS